MRTLIVMGLMAGLSGPGRPTAHQPRVLFDGRSLSGWTVRGGHAEFRVEDGQIVGATKAGERNSFLCTERAYGDFTLELDFKTDPGLNSGVQIRSESTPEYKDGVVHGYQVEIDPSPRAWTGGIYDESRRGWLVPLDTDPTARGAFRQGEWNHLKIVAKGDRIRTWVNGVPAADLYDGLTPSGFVALQVHGVARKEPMEVRFRNLMIEEE